MRPIRRVLIANRGEIAVRIIRACRELGLESVAVFSEADRYALHTQMADVSVCIGPPEPRASYLDVDRILAAAHASRADALHPGYGFLSEDPALPEGCAKLDISFVGPSSAAIRAMGDKERAREIVRGIGVPVLPGTDAPVDAETSLDQADQVGYPVLIKAARGGGGRGIRLVRDRTDLAREIGEATAEALAAFGDGRVYLERYVRDARHVEVQLLADRHGNVVHVGERDCSIQIRHQKLVEESPCPAIDDTIRDQLQAAAVRIARHIGYESAGTIEFLVDQDSGRYWFIEMNTRIQVEHPVSEVRSGIDLVQQQLRIAAWEPLAFSQKDVLLRGHAIECRITAMDPARGFRPHPGRIAAFDVPSGPGVRVDTHCYAGYVVPPNYDALLAKIIAWAESRDAAISRMRRALLETRIEGIPTTLPFHLELMTDAAFVSSAVNTRWLEDRLASPAGAA